MLTSFRYPVQMSHIHSYARVEGASMEVVWTNLNSNVGVYSYCFLSCRMSPGSRPQWWRWSPSTIRTTARGWSWTLGNWRLSRRFWFWPCMAFLCSCRTQCHEFLFSAFTCESVRAIVHIFMSAIICVHLILTSSASGNIFFGRKILALKVFFFPLCNL